MPVPVDSPGVDKAYRRVLERVKSGEFRPGTRLPGERALAADLGVSRSTLRASLARLSAEGWVDSSYKRGWFVRQQAVGEPPNTLLSFTEMAEARGATAQSHVLQLIVRSSTFEEANELAIVPSAEIVELTRIRSMDHVPICFDHTILPHELVPGIETLDLEDQSLYALLGSRYKLHVARSLYMVSAELMNKSLADQLRVPVGSAALVAREVTEDANGRPLLLARLVYRGGAYRFEANLYRP